MVNIAVIGTGYVGTVAAVAFAAIGHQVTGIEVDPVKLSALRTGTVPFHEPGLDERLRHELAQGRISFTDDLAAGVAGTRVVFLCVGTPPGPDGRPDLSMLRAAAAQVGSALADGAIAVTKSTVPIGWGGELRTIIAGTHPAGADARFGVVSNPEFLREGSATHDFLYPDRVVIGGDDEDAVDEVARMYRPILEQTFPGGNRSLQPALIRTDVATAETIKYAANGFLATKIAYINEIARICDSAGADVEIVAEAVGLDHRIERKFLNAGTGYGGSCFGKDLAALSTYGEDHGIELPILDAVNPSNIIQRNQVVGKLRAALGDLTGRRVAILGLSYKPNTDDLREAPSITIVESLLAAGARVVAYDPIVKGLPTAPGIAIARDAYEAATGADAVVLVTEWSEFDDLNFRELSRVMAGDVFIDGRNRLDPAAVTEGGLRYMGMGRR